MPANSRPPLLEASAIRPILLDAAMGTRLIAAGLRLKADDPALWVLDHPAEVERCHRLDIEAGSDALITNTFGANGVWLERFGRSGDVGRINVEAASLAREIAGSNRYLVGSIGPTALGRRSALLEQVEALLDGPGQVDALLLETFRLDQAEPALRLLADCPLPIIASLYDWPEPIPQAIDRLVAAGAAAIGTNCGPGVDAALELARKLRAASEIPILVKPAAASPGRVVDNPERFGNSVPELLRGGVRLIGGCCGSTEHHIAALRRGLDQLSPI